MATWTLPKATLGPQPMSSKGDLNIFVEIMNHKNLTNRFQQRNQWCTDEEWRVIHNIRVIMSPWGKLYGMPPLLDIWLKMAEDQTKKNATSKTSIHTPRKSLHLPVINNYDVTMRNLREELWIVPQVRLREMKRAFGKICKHGHEFFGCPKHLCCFDMHNIYLYSTAYVSQARFWSLR